MGLPRGWTVPGAMQLTRMPVCPSSSAKAFVKDSRAVLLTAYRAMGATGTYAVYDDMNTMLPPCPAGPSATPCSNYWTVRMHQRTTYCYRLRTSTQRQGSLQGSKMGQGNLPEGFRVLRGLRLQSSHGGCSTQCHHQKPQITMHHTCLLLGSCCKHVLRKLPTQCTSTSPHHVPCAALPCMHRACCTANLGRRSRLTFGRWGLAAWAS